jgi:hypothetical protein
MPVSNYKGIPRALLTAAAVAVVAGVLVLAPGCWYYSLTGASIPTHLTTVAIPLADDRSVGSPAGLEQRLTDLLIDRFAGRTRLNLVAEEQDADAVVFAEIERYSNEPAAVTGGEVAALNRVTISVRIRYVDRVEDRQRLEASFSQRETYDATRVDDELATAERVLAQIADDIFTAATSDW